MDDVVGHGDISQQPRTKWSYSAVPLLVQRNAIVSPRRSVVDQRVVGHDRIPAARERDPSAVRADVWARAPRPRERGACAVALDVVVGDGCTKGNLMENPGSRVVQDNVVCVVYLVNNHENASVKDAGNKRDLYHKLDNRMWVQ